MSYRSLQISLWAGISICRRRRVYLWGTGAWTPLLMLHLYKLATEKLRESIGPLLSLYFSVFLCLWRVTQLKFNQFRYRFWKIYDLAGGQAAFWTVMSAQELLCPCLLCQCWLHGLLQKKDREFLFPVFDTWGQWNTYWKWKFTDFLPRKENILSNHMISDEATCSHNR